MTIRERIFAELIVMSSTFAERCFGLHRHQSQAAVVLYIRPASKCFCNEGCAGSASVLRRKPQHLSQRSQKRAGKAVCAYQRTAIAPPRGGTFPLPIDYTQVQSIALLYSYHMRLPVYGLMQ